jgi:hypothetical protein
VTEVIRSKAEKDNKKYSTLVLSRTRQWSSPLFALAKPVFDHSKALAPGTLKTHRLRRIRQFKALIFRFAKIDWQEPF